MQSSKEPNQTYNKLNSNLSTSTQSSINVSSKRKKHFLALGKSNFIANGRSCTQSYSLVLYHIIKKKFLHLPHCSFGTLSLPLSLIELTTVIFKQLLLCFSLYDDNWTQPGHIKPVDCSQLFKTNAGLWLRLTTETAYGNHR